MPSYKNAPHVGAFFLLHRMSDFHYVGALKDLTHGQ